MDLHCDLYVTGSNSKLLSGDNVKLIGGRYIKIELYPLSFNEILEYRTLKGEKITNELENKLFQDYIKYGGLPRIILMSDDVERYDILIDIYNSIILDEVISKNKVKDTDFLEE